MGREKKKGREKGNREGRGREKIGGEKGREIR